MFGYSGFFAPIALLVRQKHCTDSFAGLKLELLLGGLGIRWAKNKENKTKTLVTWWS